MSELEKKRHNNLFIKLKGDDGQTREYPVVPLFPVMNIGGNIYVKEINTCKRDLYVKSLVGRGAHGEYEPTWSCGSERNLYSRIEQDFENTEGNFWDILFPQRNSDNKLITVNFVGFKDYDFNYLDQQDLSRYDLISKFIEGTDCDISKVYMNTYNPYCYGDRNRCANTILEGCEVDESRFPKSHKSKKLKNVVRSVNVIIDKLIEQAKNELSSALAKAEEKNFDYKSEGNLKEIKDVIREISKNIPEELIDKLLNEYEAYKVNMLIHDNSKKDFVENFSEYLSFKIWNMDTFGHDSGFIEDDGELSPAFYNHLYIVQAAFYAIMFNDLDKPAGERRDIFNKIIYFRDVLERNDASKIEIKNFQNPFEYIIRNALTTGKYNPSEEEISKITNSAYCIYNVLVDPSAEAKVVTQISFPILTQERDTYFGFIHNGVFCRMLYDVCNDFGVDTDGLEKPPKRINLSACYREEKKTNPKSEQKTSSENQLKDEDLHKENEAIKLDLPSNVNQYEKQTFDTENQNDKQKDVSDTSKIDLDSQETNTEQINTNGNNSVSIESKESQEIINLPDNHNEEEKANEKHEKETPSWNQLKAENMHTENKMAKLALPSDVSQSERQTFDAVERNDKPKEVNDTNQLNLNPQEKSTKLIYDYVQEKQSAKKNASDSGFDQNSRKGNDREEIKEISENSIFNGLNTQQIEMGNKPKIETANELSPRVPS